ncbi:Flp pilus assembly protein CpaB [Nereida sp. NH-UV-3]|uniref:Flp pilus assembly protein CpaB n=1 Tax=Nereida TaxID=282198 RepID=UPI0036F3325F
MRLVFALVLLLGIGLAAMAVHFTNGYVSEQRAELEAQRAAASQVVETTEVFITTRAIRYGEPMTENDMTSVLWPSNAVPEGAFTSGKDIFPQGLSVRRIALRAMERGEAVLEVKVSEPGADAGITSRLKPGMRAFAINVNEQSGVSGFLRPRDRVDVYWTGTVEVNNRAQRITRLINTGLELIAIDQSADIDRSGAQVAGTVTVEVTPQQVAILTQAQATGSLSLSLVGNDDTSGIATFEVDQNKMLGIEVTEQVAAPQRAPERVCTIKTRKGADVVEIPIPCSD